MKKLICILEIILLITALCACAKGPVSTQQEELIPFEADETWALENSSSRLTVALKDNKPYLTQLATDGGKNIINGENEMFLPEDYEIDGERINFNWVYEEAEYNNEFLKLYFTDSIGFDYSVTVICEGDSDGAYEISGEFTNKCGKDINYTNLELFYTSFAFPEETTAWTFKKESGAAEGWTLRDGRKYEGTGIYKDVMADKTTLRINTNPANGWNSNGYIPIIYFDSNSQCGAYVALEWPDGKLEAFGKGNNTVKVNVNISEHGTFATKVKNDDTFIIPTLYLGAYDGDIEDGSNIFKRWFYENKAPESLRQNISEPLTQMDMQMGLDASSLGFQSIKWDYGWWSDERVRDPIDPTVTWTWQTLEGSWQVRNSAYINVLKGYNCKTLKEFTDMAKQQGLSLATYVLLHDSIEDVDFGLTSHEGHGNPEWFGPTQITTGRSADLGNEECVEFLKTELETFFVDNGVTTWRSDFEPISVYSDKENRHYARGNDVTYWCATGFYDIVDYLIDNVEGFRYESCCSGGAMKDFATLTRASVINNDDTGDYTSLRMTFYDSSYCLPPAQLQSPCNIDGFNPDTVYYNGTGDTDFGMRSVMMGAVMLSSQTLAIDRDVYYEYCTMYNEKIKPLVRNADLYHILPRPDGVNWDGMQYADKDSKNQIKGCVFIFKPTDQEGDTKNIKLRGLYEDREYIITSEDERFSPQTISGKSLMESGFDMTITEDMGSDILWITEK